MGVIRDLKTLNDRIVLDYERLAELAAGFKAVGLKTVVTIGTFDGLHVGHSRYLAAASGFGDLFIVGTDSDEIVKRYKGPQRPIVPQNERMEMLLHTSYPDFVTLLEDADEGGNWQYGLLKAVRPDVFVAVVDSYPPEQLADIRKYCGHVDVLERQAQTSSSEKLRQAMIAQSAPLADQLEALAARIRTGEV